MRLLRAGAALAGTSGSQAPAAAVAWSYDAAGERVHATTTAQRSAQLRNPDYDDDYYGDWADHPSPTVTAYYSADVREDYGYAADGSLASVRVAESGFEDNYDGTLIQTSPGNIASDATITYTYGASGGAQGVASLDRQMGDDREIGARGRVGLTTPLFPALQGRQRDAIGAGESLLRQPQPLADRAYIGNVDGMNARYLAGAPDMSHRLIHRRDQVLAKAAHRLSPCSSAASLIAAASAATAFFSSGVKSFACALA